MQHEFLENSLAEATAVAQSDQSAQSAQSNKASAVGNARSTAWSTVCLETLGTLNSPTIASPNRSSHLFCRTSHCITLWDIPEFNDFSIGEYFCEDARCGRRKVLQSSKFAAGNQWCVIIKHEFLLMPLERCHLQHACKLVPYCCVALPFLFCFPFCS